MTFRQWVETNDIADLPDVVYRYAEAAWQAAQQAERQRIMNIISMEGNSGQWMDACDRMVAAIAWTKGEADE